MRPNDASSSTPTGRCRSPRSNDARAALRAWRPASTGWRQAAMKLDRALQKDGVTAQVLAERAQIGPVPFVLFFRGSLRGFQASHRLSGFKKPAHAQDRFGGNARQSDAIIRAPEKGFQTQLTGGFGSNHHDGCSTALA